MRKNKILYFTILSIISFLVCRCTSQEKKNSEIVVEDSIFGGKENRDNWNRAFAYSDMLRKTKGEITTYSPRYLYKIFLYEKEAYKKIISFEADLN